MELKSNTKYQVEGLNTLAKQANAFVKSVGFDEAEVPLRVALIHSEISEAFEAFRKDRFFDTTKVNFLNTLAFDDDFKREFEKHCKDTFEDEIADSIIRLLDLCGKMGIDLEYHISQKMRYNAMRGYKFGGKKF